MTMPDVFARRLEALRKKLAAAEVDGFVSAAPPDNEYLTGFNGTTSVVVVTAQEALFLCDSRYTEQAGEQVQGYAVEEVKGGLMKAAGERLEGMGVESVAFEPACTTVAQVKAVEEAFHGATRPVADMVASLRMVKSTVELERVEAASALAEGVLADLLDTLAPGVTEREIAARFEYEFKTRGARGASFDTIVLFGPRSSLPHGQPGVSPLERGHAVLLDFGCRLDGYCSDLTRTYVYDTMPGAWFEEVYEVTLAAQRAGLEAIRAGVACRDVDQAARAVIAEAGYGEHFGHGLGHGVGLEVHEGPRLSFESDAVLEAGMVVTVEPGVYLPGRGGVRIEDLVVVTEKGCRLLSHSPKELKVLKG